MITERVDDITSNLSIRIFKGYGIRHDADWHERKTKTTYTLWCITQGNVWIKINNREYTAQEGSVVFFYPEDSYSAHTDENGCEFVYIFFSLEMGGSLDLLSDMNLAGIIPPEKIQDTSLSFCRQFTEAYTPAQQISLGLYTRFAGFLCELINIQRNSDALLFYPKSPHKHTSVMATVLDYISDNYRGPLTVKDLAQLAGLSEKRFISTFKLIVGISPGQYISQFRMREAAELLINTDQPLYEIALHLGYSDQYAFSKAFKRSYGEAPASFRRSAILKNT